MSKPHEDNPFLSPRAAGDSRFLRSFSPLYTFWVALGVAVAIGVLLVIASPGLAILWGLLFAPGFLRAYVRLHGQRQEQGRTPSGGFQMAMIVVSVLLIIPLLTASFILGGVVCTGGVVMASLLHGGQLSIVLGLGGGGAVLLAAFIVGFIWSLQWRVLKEERPESPAYGEPADPANPSGF